RQVVEQPEVLVQRVDSRIAGRAWGGEGDGPAGQADLAAIQPMDAADRLHQRRLAGPVVAQQRDDLALADGESRTVERSHRAIRLHGASPLQQRGHAFAFRRRLSSRPRSTSSSSDAITSTPIAISCQNGLTPSRSSPLRITPIISAPARTLVTRPRPPRKL